MDGTLAIEANRQALKRIVAMLVEMAGWAMILMAKTSLEGPSPASSGALSWPSCARPNPPPAA